MALTFRLLPKYPARILGGTGIETTTVNGNVVVDMDWSEIDTQTAIPAAPTNNVMTFDTATETFVMIPSSLLGGAVAGIADAPSDNTLYARKNGDWTATTSRTKGPVTYYVRTDGSDTNTGLTNTSLGAFLTLQKAWDTIVETVDLSGTSAGIKVADGTYTAGITFGGMPVGVTSSERVQIIGNTSTPSNCIISVNGGTCFMVGDSAGGIARVYVDGFELSTTSSGNCVECHNSSSFRQGPHMNYGACAGIHVYMHTGGYFLSDTGGYTISGGATQHYLSGFGGLIIAHGQTITLTGTPAFSSFALCRAGGQIIADENTYSGAGAGLKASVTVGGVIQTSSNDRNYFPGDVPAEIQPGGVYDQLGSTTVTDVTRSIGSVIGLTTATADNIIASGLTLPAGDWDVYFDCFFKAGATTSLTGLTASISVASTLLDSTLGRLVQTAYGAGFVPGNSFDITLKVGPTRFTSASPQTVYAVGRGDFTVSTLDAYGIMRAVPHR